MTAWSLKFGKEKLAESDRRKARELRGAPGEGAGAD